MRMFIALTFLLAACGSDDNTSTVAATSESTSSTVSAELVPDEMEDLALYCRSLENGSIEVTTVEAQLTAKSREDSPINRVISLHELVYSSYYSCKLE